MFLIRGWPAQCFAQSANVQAKQSGHVSRARQLTLYYSCCSPLPTPVHLFSMGSEFNCAM